MSGQAMRSFIYYQNHLRAKSVLEFQIWAIICVQKNPCAEKSIFRISNVRKHRMNKNLCAIFYVGIIAVGIIPAPNITIDTTSRGRFNAQPCRSGGYPPTVPTQPNQRISTYPRGFPYSRGDHQKVV